MVTVKKLIYGTDEINLHEGTDIAALLSSIDSALDGEHSHWVEVQGKSHPQRIFVTAGVHIRVESYERQSARVARII